MVTDAIQIAAKLKYAKYRCATITKMENESARLEVVGPAPTLTHDSSEIKTFAAEAADLSDIDQFDMNMSKANTGKDLADVTSVTTVETGGPKLQQDSQVSHPR